MFAFDLTLHQNVFLLLMGINHLIGGYRFFEWWVGGWGGGVKLFFTIVQYIDPSIKVLLASIFKLLRYFNQESQHMVNR